MMHGSHCAHNLNRCCFEIVDRKDQHGSIMTPNRASGATRGPKIVGKDTQELSRSLKDTKMDTQGASRTQYDAKMITQGTSKPENDPKMIATGTS